MRALFLWKKGDDAGMTTAEYAVGTVAACGFGGVLYKVLTSDAVVGARRSEDGAARGYLNGGDAAAVQHQYPITVPGSECARVLGKR